MSAPVEHDFAVVKARLLWLIALLPKGDEHQLRRSPMTDRHEAPPEPTGEQCNRRERFTWRGRQCMAIWYPQMGGYVSVAVVTIPGDSNCVEVWVWHDGAFPFSDDAPRYKGQSPTFLHHCDPGQFITFGQQCREFQDECSSSKPQPPSELVLCVECGKRPSRGYSKLGCQGCGTNGPICLDCLVVRHTRCRGA